MTPRALAHAALLAFLAFGPPLAACGPAQEAKPGGPILLPQQPPPVLPVATSPASGSRSPSSAVAGARARPVITQMSTSDPDCGLDAEGRVWRWATGEMEPDAPSIRGAVRISCGMSHSCVVKSDGSAWCWGNNAYGALGDGSEKSHEDPTRVVGLSSVADIAVTYGRTCARTTSGDVFCWGDSEFGKAGDGRLPDNVGREKLLPGKAILTGASSLAIGLAHACSAMSDGRLSCWGQNNSGSCGQPLRTRYVPRPAFVPKTKDIVSVSAGESITCSVDRQGSVACWGSSSYGVLGLAGPTDDSSRDVPVRVPLASSAVEVVVGSGGHACARLTTGAVHCWGHGENGQLGDGTKVDRRAPAPVIGIEKVTRIGAGLGNTCALVQDGRVWCWGKDVSRRSPSDANLDDAATPVEMR
jgi:alpha-tubulin suppressor-like RCC1 family protein